MTGGQRWLALDADLMGKPFTLDLYHRFGWAGIGTWVAFLCACKRSRVPGQIRFLSDADAAAQMGILGWDLVDKAGDNWSLEDFWLYTGRKKQTKRTRRGREMNVIATHWDHWQQTAGRAKEAERMRTSRAEKPRTRTAPTTNGSGTNVRPDRDLDRDKKQGALRAEGQRQPQDLRVATNAIRAMLGLEGETDASTEA